MFGIGYCWCCHGWHGHLLPIRIHRICRSIWILWWIWVVRGLVRWLSHGIRHKRCTSLNILSTLVLAIPSLISFGQHLSNSFKFLLHPIQHACCLILVTPYFSNHFSNLFYGLSSFCNSLPYVLNSIISLVVKSGNNFK